MPRLPQSGHTLFELLVVLAIIAFAAAIVAPAFGGSRGSLEAKAIAAAIEGELKLARSRAVLSGEAASLFIDAEGGRYRADNKPEWTAVSKKVSLAFASSAPVAGDFSTILYYPDGSSSGGEVTVAEKGRIRLVRAALNGKISVDDER